MSLDTRDGHPAMDYNEHERTYAAFIAGSKILTIAVVLVLIGMVVFLV